MWQNSNNTLFNAVKGMAANVPLQEEKGNYDIESFLGDFPQFTKASSGEEQNMAESLVPENILIMFINQANDSVLPSRWGSMWRYAAGLYVAHFCSLYLKTYSRGSINGRQAVGSADQVGTVKNATMGDTSVSYDNSAITAGTEKWGSWNATQYGAQLVTMARMAGMGGVYII